MKTDYVYISPTRAYEMSYELGRKIKESGYNPDCLVGICRGGLPIVRTLSDLFGIENVYTIRIIYYKGIKTTKKKPKLIQDVDRSFLENKRILVVDDVSDTGNSLILAANLMKKKHVKEFKIATLHYKPWSEYKPDYYIDETDKWIIYPWEVGETVRFIMEKDMKLEEKINELRRTKIPPEMIKKYVDKFE